MRFPVRSTLLFAAALLTLPQPAAAQAGDGTTVYARIANWQIARQHWDAYTADLKKNTVPILDKLLADGVIVEYGVSAAAVHTPDGYTHGTWFASRTLAGLETALAALVAAEAKLPAAERRRANTDFAGTKHMDLMVESRVIRGRTTKLTSGYIYVSTDQVQPGKMREYNQRAQTLMQPTMVALFDSGAVTSFGVDSEYVHTADPNIRTRWFIVADAAALDKVDQAQAAAMQKRTAEERAAIAQAAREILVAGSHRDELWELLAYGAKY